MVIRMVVLTKSSKYGQNCVAGIELNNGNWVRLVTEDENSHGAVSDQDLICEDGSIVNLFDVIDVPIIRRDGNFIQPENVLLDVNTYITIVGSMALDQVLNIHPLENRINILGNEYAYITATRVGQVGYSLTMVEVTNLVISQEENPFGKPKTKASFYYQETLYENMSVTDYRFYNVPNLSRYEKAIIIVSIGTPYHDRYYKFVSAIYV